MPKSHTTPWASIATAHPTLAIIALITLSAATTTATAQVRCTMPNGVIIEQRLATTCPAGATSGHTLSGNPIKVQPLPTTPTPAPATPAAPMPQTQAKAQTRQPPPPSPYDLAQTLCQSLLQHHIATTCEIESNIFSTSTIQATLPGGINTAENICAQISGTFHKARRHPNESNWELHSYTPHGSSNRPMARCQL